MTGSRFTAFVDGVPTGSVDQGQSISDAVAPLTIGHAEEAWGFMNGRLDEMTVYAQALSVDQLRAIFLAGPAGKCKFLATVPEVSEVRPSSGGNAGTVTVQLVGRGLGETGTVTLALNGQTRLVGSDFRVNATGTVITATLNLQAVMPGRYDVTLTSPRNSITIEQGFTVVEGGSARPWVNIVGRDQIRVGTQGFALVYGNAGNVDAKDVVLSVTYPAGLQSLAAKPTTSVITANAGEQAATERKDVWIDKNVPPEKVNAFPLIIKIREPQSALVCLLGTIFPGLIMEQDLYGGLLLRGYPDEVAQALARAFFDRYVAQGINEITPADLLGIIQPIADYYRELIGFAIDTATILNDMAELIDPPGGETSKCVQVVAAVDPNSKSGPTGPGIERYVAGDRSFGYVLDFENLQSATAPAQTVVVTDSLDTTSFDLSTFSFGPVTISGKQLTPPPLQKTFRAVLDLRPDNNLLAAIYADFAVQTGVATWRFESIDPVTGQAPEDPLAGFLPPNRTSPEGQGGAVFTVMPKHDLPTGTQIRNGARIVFDTNAPIETPTWSVTIDRDAPVSSVAALPATQTDQSFQVQWSGTDVGAGIRDFTIYVSDNGGPFNVALTQTANRNAIFTGVTGHTYRFHSIARDLVGNVENAKIAAEATTTVINPTADLSVTKAASPLATVTAGTNLTYTINATNDGPGNGNSLTLTDTIPAGTSFVSLTKPVNWTCSTPAVGSSGTIICTKATMMNGETATFTVVTTVDCNVRNNTSISNTATIGAVSPTDNNTANNSQTVMRTVLNPVPSLTATVSANMLWPANHDLFRVGLSATANDDACPSPTTFGVQVFGNEDDQMPTDSAALDSPDAKDIGVGTLRLRSERVESGDGRIYLIVVTATDAAGGVGFRTTTVVVPKSQSQANLDAINAKAAAAVAAANANNGTAPAGYFVIGDGPTLGPKQ